jgi:hypothetical protein
MVKNLLNTQMQQLSFPLTEIDRHGTREHDPTSQVRMEQLMRGEQRAVPDRGKFTDEGLKQAGRFVAEMLPVSGDIIAAEELYEDPTPVSAAVFGVGLIPVIGGPASKALKAALSISARNVNKGKKEAQELLEKIKKNDAKVVDDIKDWKAIDSKTNAIKYTRKRLYSKDFKEYKSAQANPNLSAQEKETALEKWREIAFRTEKEQPRVFTVDDLDNMLPDAERVVRSLASNKARNGILGISKNLEVLWNKKAHVRLDIPAYKEHNTWVATISQTGKPTIYSRTVRLENVNFGRHMEKAEKVAAGTTPKAPFATMDGTLIKKTDLDNLKDARTALDSGEWVQVGYNPDRASYFFTKGTGKLETDFKVIKHADEVIQIGGLVLAKNPTTSAATGFRTGGAINSQMNNILNKG